MAVSILLCKRWFVVVYKFQIYFRIPHISQKCLCKCLHFKLCFQKCILLCVQLFLMSIMEIVTLEYNKNNLAFETKICIMWNMLKMDTLSYTVMYKAAVHSKLIRLFVGSFGVLKRKENHKLWTSNNLNCEIKKNNFEWYLKTM
jgi:hypothetical protein